MMANVFNAQGGDRPLVPNIAITLTDIVPILDANLTAAAGIQAHVAGIYTILVTVGYGLNTGNNFLYLHSLASEPYSENFLNVVSFTMLDALSANVTDALCNKQNDCNSSPCQNGGTCVDGIGQYYCNCADRFTGVNCARTCSVQVDVVFLVDTSGSLALDGYNLELNFMDAIVQGLSFQFGRTRIAYVTFSANAQVQFCFDAYTSPLDIISAISIDSVQSGTDFTSGFNAVTNDVLGGMGTCDTGSRPGVEQVVIFLSDGMLNLDLPNFSASVTALKATGAKIYAVSLGLSPEEDTMSEIASDPSTMYMVSLPTLNDTSTAANTILDQLC
jgi:collagen type VI alpha